MSTPQSTPVRHVKLGIVSAKSLPLTNEYKKLLSDQHQRLTLKHQQDLDLLDDIRAYVKARLSIERDYTNALQKLTKQHSNNINKKFALLSQLDQHHSQTSEQVKANSLVSSAGDAMNKCSTSASSGAPISAQQNSQSTSNSQRSTHNGSGSQQHCDKPSSLYKVWLEHINRLQSITKNRSDQFEQLNMVVDKLKDIRQHKASIGKKCLDTHLRRIQEELLASMADVERAKKLYYEDESQAKKARENEERIKKKRTGLLTKFTDLQAKKEKSSAQREATDIQSTQARNDYIMALAAANAHLKYYYHRDLNDFIHLIDDGVLDHCKLFMATLSECDINSLKEALQQVQCWSKLINMTGSQQTNFIFLECEQSKCLRTKQELAFEACNNDPMQKISLEHNADYALQHEIDKWFTWFKKECRNLSQLMHQLDTCQHAFAEGKKSIEVNGQTVEDLEPKIIELKQQIRKCEAAKLKAQARLKVIKEGGMQIEEWSDVELEIRADMARAQEALQRAQRLKDTKDKSMEDSSLTQEASGAAADEPSSVRDGQYGASPSARTGAGVAVQLQISHDSDDDDTQASIHNLASVSRSTTSNLMQKQQNAITGYSALTDPSLVWQDDYSAAWGGGGGASGGGAGGSNTPDVAQQGSGIVVSSSFDGQQQAQPLASVMKSPAGDAPGGEPGNSLGDDKQKQQQMPNANMSIQSSSPLSAIVNGGQHLSQSPYQVGIMSEAYKSDYECDYTRTGHHASMRSAASSVEPSAFQNRQSAALSGQANEFGDSPPDIQELIEEARAEQQQPPPPPPPHHDVEKLLNRRVIALYAFERNNVDDLAFNEDDLLTVIETNPEDTNWIKARLEATGEEGFIPSSYVRLIDGQDQPATQRQSHADEAAVWRPADQRQSVVDESHPRDESDPSHTYCRALYDYTPERDTFEEDGLPHLALKQGELMRVVDQGADDGWWLVEKADTGTRGHVPSMLVNEVDPADEDEAEESLDEDEDFDDGDVSDREVHDEDGAGLSDGPPPSFEAPVLNEPDIDDLTATLEEKPKREEEEAEDVDSRKHQANEFDDVMEKTTKMSDSLIPTSFIIIEPTPEVESMRFEDNLIDGDREEGDENNNHRARDTHNAQEAHIPDNDGDRAAVSEADGLTKRGEDTRQPSGGRQIVVTEQQPSSQVSYSVVNQDFILEKPTRKPYQHSSASNSIDHPAGHHHEPTIEEVDDRLEREETVDNSGGPLVGEAQERNFNGEPNELPSVVIDSVEAIPRSPDLSFDESPGAAVGDEQEDASDCGPDEVGSQHSEVSSEPSTAKKPIKHTGNVDVSPILRHHAEEFCKQLIEEAILLAPGSRIGPSTSSASVMDEGC